MATRRSQIYGEKVELLEKFWDAHYGKFGKGGVWSKKDTTGDKSLRREQASTATPVPKLRPPMQIGMLGNREERLIARRQASSTKVFLHGFPVAAPNPRC